ncbi:MAG TPA: hypothetical protein VFA27_17120 [Vicinamibacterales bacterium]|nr:hypothetical protein [Vicinamibacterales bacterium]
MNWQRVNIQAAATYLRERIAAGATDPKTKTVYEGLLEVLDPTRRTARLQREMLSATQSAVPVAAVRERRAHVERRRIDRRKVNLGSPTGVERRAGRDRRTGRDRRNG